MMRRLLAALFLIASTVCMAQAPASYVTVGYMQGQGFILTTAPNTYGAGMKQTFAASATTAGFALTCGTSDPSGAVLGDFWCRSDLSNSISFMGPSGIVRVLASSGSGPLTLTGLTSGLPAAPAAGNGTFFISTTFVGQTENPSGAVSGTQVVPRTVGIPGQHVSWIDANGVQQYTADTTPPVMVASGASHAAGLAPDPGVTAGTTKFLREDATWQVPAGGGGGVSLSPAASQTILAANTTTTPLGTDTPASPTVDVFFVKIAGSSKIRVDQFGTIQLDNGTINSNSGVLFTAGGSFGVVANKNGVTGDFNVSSGWTGSAIAGDVVAVTSGTHAVADCATSCVNAYGVVQATPNTNDQVQTAGQVTVNLDATFSPVGGWFACSSAVTAGKAIVQAAACAAGRQIGYVTTAGTSVTTIPIVLQFK